MKRFQEVNRPKFKRKWMELYRHHGVEERLQLIDEYLELNRRIYAIDLAVVAAKGFDIPIVHAGIDR